MRFTLAFAVVAAIGAHATPQYFPITQISDGQIQAPPTPISSLVSVPAVTAITPTVVSTAVIPSGSVASSSGGAASDSVSVAPSSTTASVTVAVPVPSSGVSSVLASSHASNSTVSTGAPSSTGPGESSTATSPPSQTGAASANMASFGGLALAIFGFVLV